MRILKSYLAGTWQSGEGSGSTLYNATTGAPYAEVSTAGLDLGAALAHARRVGGASLRALSYAQRGELLNAMAGALRDHREELLTIATENMGSTRGDGKFDVDGAAGTLGYYSHMAGKLGEGHHLLDGGQVRVSRSKRFVGQHILTPRRGVAIHINAFNFPAWNMCEKAAAALLAGMPIFVKAATATSALAVRIVELWVESGVLPEGSVSLLSGSAGDLLDHLERQDCIVFTGSGDTGRKIRSHQRVLDYNIPVNVEADSLNAAVVGPDVELGSETYYMFLAEVVRELTQKAGQKCTAIRRILIPEALLEGTLEGLVERLEDQKLGDPAERTTRIGPLSTRAQKGDIQGAIAQLSEHATRIWGEPDSVPEEGFFIAPQLFQSDQGAEASYVHEHEVFGPVATVLPYSGGADEAIEIVSKGGGGLVASVYSDDRSWSKDVLFGLAPWHGRILWGSAKIHDQSTGHGAVMPGLVHGGPGMAGGGEELGGERGLGFYCQRTAIQGDSALLKRIFGSDEVE